MNSFDIEKAGELAKKIDYTFKNIKLLEEALSHPSLKQQSKQGTRQLSYERLELLGDAVLGFIITEILFVKFPHYNEGEIAKIKAYLVSKDSLLRAANRIDLPSYIIMTQGEENGGGRGNPGNIENTMEALIASVYLDGEIVAAKKLINSLWQDLLENINFSEVDPKTSLQEWCQSDRHIIPHYEIIDKKGPAHMPIFTVKVFAGSLACTGSGRSIKLAEKSAARNLLAKIRVNS